MPVLKVVGKGLERVQAVADPKAINAVYAEVAFTYPEGATLEEVQSALLDARNQALAYFRSGVASEVTVRG